MEAILVVPTVRDLSFLEQWKAEFSYNPDVSVIVVEDRNKITLSSDWDNVTIYSHKEIKEELGDCAWIFPHHTSAIRSFGFWKAWQENPDMIITLDDDCFPHTRNFRKRHWQNLQKKATLDWIPVGNLFTRGFPYAIRKQTDTVISHGTWIGIPDLDAPTQLTSGNRRFIPKDQIIPRNNFFAMSGMNLAWRPDVTPLLYFGLQSPDWPYQRFDDIWAGILAKKVLDHLSLAVHSGYPVVEHKRKSNVFTNLKKEASGIELNELFWKQVVVIPLTETTIKGAYRELIEKLSPPSTSDSSYFQKLKEASLLWLSLFSE